jgi:hypothetical protein
MTILKRIGSTIGGGIKIVTEIITNPSGKVSEAAKMDIRRAAVLCKGYEWYAANNGDAKTQGAQPTENDVVEFYTSIANLKHDGMKKLVATKVTEQVIGMFEALKRYEESLTSQKPSSISNFDSKSLSTSPLIDIHGFSLQVGKSNVEGAGDGVFVNCAPDHVVWPGTVLALVPGHVHLTEYTCRKEHMTPLFPDENFMLFSRDDGVLVDARVSIDVPYNPYAIGHMINHPDTNRGGEPNVLQVSYDFRQDPFEWDEFPRDLRKYIPNVYAKPPTIFGTPERSAYMKSVVVMAAKPLLNGDELFMDYRLHPDFELPSWYSHYDEEGAKARRRS